MRDDHINVFHNLPLQFLYKLVLHHTIQPGDLAFLEAVLVLHYSVTSSDEPLPNQISTHHQINSNVVDTVPRTHNHVITYVQHNCMHTLVHSSNFQRRIIRGGKACISIQV